MAKKLSKAQLDQRRAAAARPRGGRREWTAIKVSADVLDKIDRNRGEVSRNEYLDKLVPLPFLMV